MMGPNFSNVSCPGTNPMHKTDSSIVLTRSSAGRWFFLASSAVVWLIGAIFVGFAVFANPVSSVPGIACFAVVWTLVSGVFASPVFRRITISREGIASRWLIWNRFWRWDDFKAGDVKKTPRHVFENANRRLGFRMFDFSFLQTSHVRMVYEASNRHFESPVGESIVPFEFDWCDKSYRVNEGGVVEYAKGKLLTEFEWSRIESVHFLRNDSKRFDFKTAVFRFPNSEFAVDTNLPKHPVDLLTQRRLTSFVAAYVPADKVFETCTGDPMSDGVLNHHNINRVQARCREVVYWGALLLIVILLVGLTGRRDLVLWAEIHGLILTPILIVIWLNGFRRIQSVRSGSAIAE